MIDSSFKSDIDVIYLSNLSIDELKKNSENIQENKIILTSYNYNFKHDYEHYEGTSYELYYLDSNKNIFRLTYNIIPGNGLYIDKDNLRISIDIDNNTIQSKTINDYSYLYLNSQNLRTINSSIDGIAKGDNKYYNNDILINTLNDSGTTTSFEGVLGLNNGLSQDLNFIKYYYDQIKKTSLEINRIYGLIVNKYTVFKVGDYLYKDNNGQITNINNGKPYLVCVISSGVLDDGYARFIPIKRNQNTKYFSLNKESIPVKETFSQIPIYDSDYININTQTTNIIGSSYGFIATDRDDWVNNYPLKNNINKHYFYKKEVLTIEEKFLLKKTIGWYINYDYVNNNELYVLEENAISTDQFNSEYVSNNVQNMYISLTFNDGAIRKYQVPMKYDQTQRRLVQSSYVYPTSVFYLQNVIRKNEDLITLESNAVTTTQMNASSNIQTNNVASTSASGANSGFFDDSFIESSSSSSSQSGIIYNNIDKDIYLIKIKMAANLFDIKNVYVKVYTQYNYEYFKYDNTKGLEKILYNNGQYFPGGNTTIKISCFASKKYNDNNYYDLGEFRTESIDVSPSSRFVHYKNYTVSLKYSHNFNIKQNFVVNGSIQYPTFGLNSALTLITNGVVNINDEDKEKVNLGYSIDSNMINVDSNGYSLREGAIKIYKTNGESFTFIKCIALVEINVLYRAELTYKESIEFSIDNSKNTLISERINIGYPCTNIQYVKITGFTFINDPTENIDRYIFDRVGKIIK